MPNELRKGVVRIASTYGRLAISLVAGLAQTRILLGWLGSEAYGLVAFVGSSVGLALLIEDVLRSSMIRELATGHHADPDGSTGEYRSVLHCGTVISLAGTVATALLFIALAVLMPLFKIAPSLQKTATLLILAEGFHSCVTVFTAPVYNMFVITERFVDDNVFTTIRKTSYLVVAWILHNVVGMTDPATGVIWYGYLSVAANVTVLLSASAWMMSLDPRVRPGISHATRAGVRAFLGTFGWNTTTMVAVNCYDRVGQLITNLAFGTVGNAIFGVGYQLAAYVRMVSLGVNFGTDSVAARLSTTDDKARNDAMIRFTATMTRLHAFSAFPAAAILSTLTHPVMHLWVGDRLKDPAHVLAATITCQILLLPVTVRSVTDCWTRILYGAGHIRTYAPLLLAGGILNPIVALILLAVLPDPYREYSAAISFAAIMTLFHFFLLPIPTARALNCDYRTMLLPMVRPAVAAVLPLPILIYGHPIALSASGGRPAIALLMVAAVYGILYMALSLVFVLKPEEKRKFGGMLFRKLRPGQAQA